ncbi:hypothetical protein EYR41_004686 [Orbilia oligospora]|uniref:Uncharacterized protein n=1 Tax=Orbilia oligospora TaxID=2813651 RepID=A0A7C8P753_ORBOL|nr:hypothetical protein TWF751_011207 [Orbilia oligospora]TGJ72818.1 hypothetical protein EYR41_004686 [Orbilia oligospora]
MQNTGLQVTIFVDVLGHVEFWREKERSSEHLGSCRALRVDTDLVARKARASVHILEQGRCAVLCCAVGKNDDPCFYCGKHHVEILGWWLHTIFQKARKVSTL